MDVRSVPAKGVRRLIHLTDLPQEGQWWPVATDEQTDRALGEIVDLLNRYAWNWFVLK